MKLTFRKYELEMKHTFTISNFSRKTTPVVLTEIEHDNTIGYGEASLPPYLGETQDTVIAFLKSVNLQQFASPFELEDILEYVDAIAPKNTAAKASIDIALHDLVGKLMNQPLYKIWGYNPNKTPDTSFTIGIDTEDIVKQKTKEASPYNILKIKLGNDNDKNLITTIRSVTNKPIYVDVNQGWNDKYFALDMIHWLHQQNVLLIEQPMPVNKIEDIAWLTAQSPIPIIADEGVQRLSDLKNLVGIYSGINIKLMKCTGLREANKMLQTAKFLGLKTMIGCMTETSCAVSAAAHLSPMANYADLDGNLLINNDIYQGITINSGKISLNDLPGIGVCLV